MRRPEHGISSRKFTPAPFFISIHQQEQERPRQGERVGKDYYSMEDKKKVKSLWHFVYRRMRGHEKWLWLLCVIVVIMYILSHSCPVHLGCVQDIINSVISFLNKHNNCIDGWTYGIISGIFVYFFTVILPTARRSSVITPVLVEYLRYISDEFKALSQLLCDCDWCTNGNAISKAVDTVRKTTSAENNEMYSLADFHVFILGFLNRIDKYTDYILNNHELLQPDELNCLSSFKHADVFNKIRSDEFFAGMFTNDDLKCILENIVIENRRTNELYDIVCKRVYKQNK